MTGFVRIPKLTLYTMASLFAWIGCYKYGEGRSRMLEVVYQHVTEQGGTVQASFSIAMAFVLQTFSIVGFIAAQALAAPNPSVLGTSITILKENDLYGPFSNKTSSAILVEQPKSYASAKSTCSAFSEGLWSPEAQDFTAGLNNTLSYQAYLRKFSYIQQFWVAEPANESTAKGCRAIDLAGKARNLDCSRLLPALCTHSAPLSNETFWDLSEPYQVSVTSDDGHSTTGFRDAFGFRFMGIRYAENPGRFAHTTVFSPPGDVTALEYGSWCFQLENGEPYGSEDCFFLNIGTPYLPAPDAPAQSLKPVLLWIHGGGFTGNSGDLGHTDGINIASRGDFVVVKINYRLGHFGWLAIDGTSITGNYGLGDIISALKWVQQNIKAFGGDAGKVTVGGDSAGAAGVRALLSSEAAKGLFRGGIMESMPNGYFPTTFYSQYMTIPESSALFGPTVKQVTGCTSISGAELETCLKNADPVALNSAVVQAIGRQQYPVQDKIFLNSRGLGITGKSYAAHVPVIMGVNRDETAIDLSPYYGITNVTQFLALVSQVVQRDLTSYANNPAFPLPSGGPALSAFNLTQRVLTDAGYKCLAWATAYSATKHKILPEIYTYEFNRTYQPGTYTSPLCQPAATVDHPFGDPDSEYFKCHSSEVGLAFGELVGSERSIRDENDVPFEQLVVDYWSAFIWSGNPNPKEGFLKARGYWGTLNQITRTGKWENINTRTPKMRRMQWNGGMVDQNERAQCEALHLPLTYYEELFG